MQFRILAVLFVFVLSSCGTRKYNMVSVPRIPKISKSKLIDKININSFKNSEIKTVKINSKLSYEIANSSQKLGLKTRIAKGEKIWLSANFLNIPVAKLMIDRDSIHYYNKIDKTYFEGSFEFIKHLVGVDVNYEMLESLFTGDMIVNLDKGFYTLSRDNDIYTFKNTKTKSSYTEVEIYPLIHKIKSQSVKKTRDEKGLTAYYGKYQNIKDVFFPKDISVRAKNKEKNSLISISYSSVTFDEELKYPYKRPKDCNQEIVIGNGEIKNRKEK